MQEAENKELGVDTHTSLEKLSGNDRTYIRRQILTSNHFVGNKNRDDDD